MLAAYFYLARKWPKFMKKWHEVDLSMQRAYNFPSNLNARFKIITTIAFTAAAGIQLTFLVYETLRNLFSATYGGYYYCTGDGLILDSFNRLYNIIGTDTVLVYILKVFVQVWCYYVALFVCNARKWF